MMQVSFQGEGNGLHRLLLDNRVSAEHLTLDDLLPLVINSFSYLTMHSPMPVDMRRLALEAHCCHLHHYLGIECDHDAVVIAALRSLGRSMMNGHHVS